MIDSHAHLQAGAFAGDLDAVLEQAAGAGIGRILIPGWDLPSSRAAVRLCGKRGPAAASPSLVAAAGIHPHTAGTADADAWRALADLAREEAVAAIGETGLDYDRMFSPRAAQLASLRRHVALALELGKPLIVHCRSARGRRDAQDELLAELAAAGIGGAVSAAFGLRPPAVLHSFSGPLDYAESALALGLAVSFSGLVFRAGEVASAEVARVVPADRLLVETDSPYLSPPGGPRRNEPARVRVTAAWLAERRAISPESLERDLEANFERIFGPIRPA